MLDLIAITAGFLSFIAWSVALSFGGYALRRRHEARERQRRIDRLIADAKRVAGVTYKREPSDDVKRRAQA